MLCGCGRKESGEYQIPGYGSQAMWLFGGENYPYHGDVLWVTVPDHADWLYRKGEEATVEVQFYKYGIPRDGVVEYAIGNDLMDADTKGTLKLKNGRGIINAGSAERACFRDIRLKMELDGTVYNHHVKIGFSPEEIVPYTKMPEDFWQFWQDNLAEEGRHPLKYEKVYCPEFSNDKTDCYLVHIELNPRHQYFYGYLMMPKNAKPGSHPVMLSPPGAGVIRIKDPNALDYIPEDGIIRFITEIHGVNPLMPETGSSDAGDSVMWLAGYLSQGLDSRNRYYMKHVYLGQVRCIDFLTQLPEWDGKNVITQGGSQGGALALVAAALDPRVTLCVADCPAFSDMAAGVEEGRTHGFPHFSRAEGFLTEQHLNTLPYFDVCSFAPHIKAKTMLTWGYNDNICPPTTSYAVWNLLTCEKESLVTPINEHWTSDATKRKQLDWVLKNLK